MSKEQLNKILTKAMSDRQFLDLLLKDPKKACEGFDVSDEEIENLKKQLSEKSEAELDQRISKRKLGGGSFGDFSGPMGIDDIDI